MLSSAKDKVDEVFRPYLLYSENIANEDASFLGQYFSTVKLPSFPLLQDAVSSHADMLLCPIGDSLAVHRLYYEANRELFDQLRIKTIQTDEPVHKKYPGDILLNGLFLSEDLYGRIDKLSRLLTSHAKSTVNVRQGYARCSVCKINEKAIITADESIARAAAARGIDVLTITPGHILLKGYDYGFIGGASVTYKDTVFFFGKAEDHPDYDKMLRFASKYSVRLVSASQNPLCDIGGGIIYE